MSYYFCLELPTAHCLLHTIFATICRLAESGGRWLMDSANKELFVILAVMIGLLIFGIIAVVIFVRVWRRERK